MANLSPAPDGRSYQVWFYPTADAEPIPGQTFAVDSTGAAFLLIPADVGVFTTITVTIEPEAGTTAPTGPVILSGETGGARG
jgi:anti-sigma-K factor RskA